MVRARQIPWRPTPAASASERSGLPDGRGLSAAHPGRGALEIAHVAGRSIATRAHATNPLGLLIPTRRTPAAWVYTSTFGGGLVAGDEIDLDVCLQADTACVLSGQSSTKVYKNPPGLPSRQNLHATVAENATLVVAPDPVTCFAGAVYDQTQRFDLHPAGALVLVDWLTSGRRARGERWSFSRYRSRLDIFVADELVLTDRLLLDPRDGPLDSPLRLGRFNCLGVVVIMGQRFTPLGESLLAETAKKPIEPGSTLIDSASPLAGGAIWKILGETTEEVGRRLRQGTSFLTELLGGAPWSRKW